LREPLAMIDKTETSPQLILASTSPYRAEMLAKCGLSFSQESPEYIEQIVAAEAPQAAALRLACGKARTIVNSLKRHDGKSDSSSQIPARVVIGCDQVACLNGVILGKPGSESRAIEQLTVCSDEWVSFHTGLFVSFLSENGLEPTETSYIEEFAVKFRLLTAAEIETYIAMDQPLDCAGSFKAEGLGLTLFEDMKGRDIHTLYGLPLLQLLEILRGYGINPISPR